VFALGLTFLIANIILWRHKWRWKGRNFSAWMLFGGLFMSLGMGLMPFPPVQRWCWVPIVLDPWGLPVGLLLFAWIAWRDKQSCV